MAHWKPAHSKALCHLLHEWALDLKSPRLSKGYVKRDSTLRRGRALPKNKGRSTPEARQRPITSYIAEVLAGQQPDELTDGEWFEVRWTMGEGDATEALAVQASQEAATLNLHEPLASPIAVYASMAVGKRPIVCPRGEWMVVGPDTSALSLWLHHSAAILSASLPEDRGPLSEETYDFWAMAQALTLIRHRLDEAQFKELIGPLSALWMPVGLRAHDIEQMVRAIAARHLDEPPGEIGRIAEGLARRLDSRIERCARRGFFIPSTQPLKSWLDAHRGTVVVDSPGEAC